MEHKEPRPSRSRCPPQPDSTALKRPLWPLPGESQGRFYPSREEAGGFETETSRFREENTFPWLDDSCLLADC